MPRPRVPFCRGLSSADGARRSPQVSIEKVYYTLPTTLNHSQRLVLTILVIICTFVLLFPWLAAAPATASTEDDAMMFETDDAYGAEVDDEGKAKMTQENDATVIPKVLIRLNSAFYFYSCFAFTSILLSCSEVKFC